MVGLAEEEVEQAPWVIWAKRGGGLVLLIAVVIGVVLLGRELASPTKPQQRQAAKIRIVPDTPPPPPPPPKEEKRPEPPKDVKEVKVEQPKEAPPAPTEQLKMEGEGSDKGLAGIAAGAVAKDYIGQPPGGGSRFALYGGMVQQQVQQALSKSARLRNGEFRLNVKLWLSAEGAVTRAELASSTGNGDTDELIRTALLQMPPLRERPPDGMPMPVRLRVVARI